MKNGMKQTEIGKIPVDWEVVKLGDIFQRSTRKNAENNQNALTISAQMGLVSQTDYFNKTVASKNLLGYYLLHRGDFAYNKSYSAGYPMGVIKQLDRYDKGVVSTLYICFSRTDKQSCSDFYTHYFESGNFNAQLAGIAQEGARAHGLLNVGAKDFFNLLIVKPALHEQRKIAEILSTLDEKMALIDKQLAQTQELKNGLTGYLVTKGIGHTQFQDSPLGEIPANWEIARGDEISSLITKGASPGWQGFDYVKEGLLFVTSENVRGGHLDLSNPKFLPLAFNKKVAKSQLKNGDILINIVGASIGRACLYESPYEVANVNQAVCVLRSNDKVLSNYLIYFLQAPDTIKRLLGTQAGSARQNLSLSDIRGFIMALPPLPEQRQIAEILTTVDAKISVLQDKKAQYHTLKKGLMQQLLTGQRRVRVAEQVPALV